jgi:6-phosphogluconolactonase (cycloisomerase 2 family)
MSRFILHKFLALAALAFCVATSASAHRAESVSDTVYTMSNAASGNTILSFKQDAQGHLIPAASYPTGGQGSGGGLGNQGGIVSDGEFLIVVNAGSDDVSVFKVSQYGLRLADRTSSGGIRPVSVTIDHNLVYVVNAGSDNIAGFWMSESGRLHALPGSEHGLSGTGVGPAQISFSGDGKSLIVTEKATNKIVTFSLGRKGIPVDMHVTDSAAPTPFGFGVTKHHVIVSEAAGGAPNASALSSYRVRHDGEVDVVDPAVATTQTAACWVVITADGRFVYVANTGSSTISTYRLHRNGDLTLLAAAGGMTGAGSAPADVTLSDDGDFLHVRNGGTNTIVTFKIMDDGGLLAIGSVGNLPASASGLIAF